MTEFEKALVSALGDVTFLPGLPAKRIVANAKAIAERGELSPKMRRALVFIGQRYRRQLPRSLVGLVIEEHSKYLAADAAGGGVAVSAAKPRAGNTHEPTRPPSAHPASPLQGLESHEGLPLWSRVT